MTKVVELSNIIQAKLGEDVGVFSLECDSITAEYIKNEGYNEERWVLSVEKDWPPGSLLLSANGSTKGIARMRIARIGGSEDEG